MTQHALGDHEAQSGGIDLSALGSDQTSYQQAQNRLISALAMMEQYRVFPIPQNIAVWYAYEGKEDPDLVRQMDNMIETGAEFTEAICHDLYERYFGFAGATSALRDATARVSSKLDGAVHRLKEAEADAANSALVFTEASDAIERADTPEALAGVASRLASHTHAMQAATQEQVAGFQEAQQELTQVHASIDQAQVEARTDQLTGLPNRRALDETLRELAHVAAETGEDFSLIVADIDDFTEFNRQYGQPVGDEVLKLVGRTISRVIDEECTVVRYGGDQFAVLLPHYGLQSCREVADRIAEALATGKIVNRKTGQKYGDISVAQGVAIFEPGEPLTRMMIRTDIVLDAAKQRGNGGIVTEEDLRSGM